MNRILMAQSTLRCANRASLCMRFSTVHLTCLPNNPRARSHFTDRKNKGSEKLVTYLRSHSQDTLGLDLKPNHLVPKLGL